MISIAPQFTRREYRWSEWRSVAVAKGLVYQHQVEDGVIMVWGYDGPEVHICIMWTGVVPAPVIDAGYSQVQNDADIVNFNSVFLQHSNKEIGLAKPFVNSNGFYVDLRGFEGLALAGVTTAIDYDVTKVHMLTGTRVILHGNAVGDSCEFQIIDKYGSFAPPGTVLSTFVRSFYMDHGASSQGDVVFPYGANIVPGMTIRVLYKSTGVDNVRVFVNLFLHSKDQL